MKRRGYNRQCKSTKAYKRLSWKLCGKKMDNLEEIDRFLENFNLPRLNQEEIEIMNNPIISTEIEAVIKNLPKNQNPRTRLLHRRTPSNIENKANAYPSKTLSKNCRGRNTSKLIHMRSSSPWYLNKKKTIHKKENYQPISLMNTDQNPQQNFSKQNSTTHQKAHTPWSS